MTSLDVVIVNWNSGVQLAECLESLAKSELVTCRFGSVIVVDNASTDGSLQGLDRLQLPLVVIRNDRNLGFGAACNLGARQGAGEQLLFLNPDTRLPPNTIEDATRALTSRERAGIVGIALHDERGAVQRSCCRLPTPWTFFVKALGLDRLPGRLVRGYAMVEWPHDRTRQVDHVIGAFYLMRAPLFRELGGFDERFFVYLEDLDLSARVKAAGWECWFLSEPTAFHKGGGTSDRIKATRLFYSLRSRLQYAAKHLGVSGAAVVCFATLLVEPFVRLAAATLAARGTQLKDTAEGFALLWRWVLRRAFGRAA